MLPQYYKLSDGLCLNNFFQFWILVNQRYQVHPFRYINQDDEVHHLVGGRKVLGDRKYLKGSVKQAAKAVGIWTEDNWYVKILNSLYTVL